MRNVSNDGLFQIVGPLDAWRNEADCNTFTWPLIPDDPLFAGSPQVALNCAGPRHVHFRDLDGTLTGQPSSVNGQLGPNPRKCVQGWCGGRAVPV